MSLDYACIEFGISRIRGRRLGVRVEYTHPEFEAPKRVEAEFILDEAALSQAVDAAAYGRALANALFKPPSVLATFTSARNECETQQRKLRLRLAVSANSPDLHMIHWEKLLDPASDARLAAGQQYLFSRLTTDFEWRETRPRALAGMKALIVAAHASNSQDYRLAEFDAVAFRDAAVQYMAGATIEHLGIDEPATPERLLQRLREGYDLLYLVCHGTMVNDEEDKAEEPVLVLHTEDRKVNMVRGSELVRQFSEVQNLPRLVLLASCNSVSDPTASKPSGLVHLAPRLAQAGIASVVGFHGNISIDGAKDFCSRFFAVLGKQGDVEAATAEGRAAISTREHEWWSPALLTRLRTGQLWYTRGFSASPRGGDGSDEGKWQTLMRYVSRGQIIPIIGPGVFISPLGSRRDLAHRWATEFGYPLASSDRASLPQVAQFVSVTQGETAVREELLRYAYTELSSAAGIVLPNPPSRMHIDDVVSGFTGLVKSRLLERQAKDPAEPFSVIARLEARVFVTLDYTDQLYDALIAQGKKPTRESCPWKPKDPRLRAQTRVGDSRAKTSVQQPLVYHLFGRLEDYDSMVLTEDDYFDFLLGISSGKDLIPSAVSSAFCKNSLMFIGCNLNEWDFRTVLRTILSQPGFQKDAYNHVSVNVDPEDSGLIDPEKARSFFRRYLAEKNSIEIFWGTAAEFLRDLDLRIAAARPPQAGAPGNLQAGAQPNSQAGPQANIPVGAQANLQRVPDATS